jgi:hypothetical protein
MLTDDENSQIEYFADEFSAAVDRGNAVEELEALCVYVQSIVAAREREAARRALLDAADEIDRKLARDIRRAKATDLLRARAAAVGGEGDK